MDVLRKALSMSPQMQEAFAAEERRREREAVRNAERARNADARLAKAEAKRARKNAQRLASVQR